MSVLLTAQLLIFKALIMRRFKVQRNGKASEGF